MLRFVNFEWIYHGFFPHVKNVYRLYQNGIAMEYKTFKAKFRPHPAITRPQHLQRLLSYVDIYRLKPRTSIHNRMQDKKRTCPPIGTGKFQRLWEPHEEDYFLAAFFAGAFLAGAFLAGAFFAGAFFAGAFLAHFAAQHFLAGAFLAGAFLAAATFLVAICFILFLLLTRGHAVHRRNYRSSGCV